ncbi:hypothetical protein M0R45_020001 [Rubus argutus]|uniref:Uncharacterized protein n=1 Tax=Rubus argutus TaxID=59490 RepID=A0AAW1X8R5_RUBAR
MGSGDFGSHRGFGAGFGDLGKVGMIVLMVWFDGKGCLRVEQGVVVATGSIDWGEKDWKGCDGEEKRGTRQREEEDDDGWVPRRMNRVQKGKERKKERKEKEKRGRRKEKKKKRKKRKKRKKERKKKSYGKKWGKKEKKNWR